MKRGSYALAFLATIFAADSLRDKGDNLPPEIPIEKVEPKSAETQSASKPAIVTAGETQKAPASPELPKEKDTLKSTDGVPVTTNVDRVVGTNGKSTPVPKTEAAPLERVAPSESPEIRSEPKETTPQAEEQTSSDLKNEQVEILEGSEPLEKVIPSPYTFDQAQAMKPPNRESYTDEEWEKMFGSDSESENGERSNLGVDDEGYEEEESSPRPSNVDNGQQESLVFQMPPDIGMNEVIDSAAGNVYYINQGSESATGGNMSRESFIKSAQDLQEAMQMYPENYAELYNKMGVTSHDFNRVNVGQKIDLRSFFNQLYFYNKN